MRDFRVPAMVGRALRKTLFPLELCLLLLNHAAKSPQIFILGLPRSGTTLAYQYVVHRMDVSYFTNGVGDFPWSPALVTAWQRWRHGQYMSDFTSVYGKVRGEVAPREAGSFWNRFFDCDCYVEQDDLAHWRMAIMKSTVFCVQALAGDKVFVNKNVKHMLRMSALAKIFPSAIFLVMERSLPEIAVSILRGRYDNSPDPSQWWSLRPPDYESFAGLSPMRQVEGQVFGLRSKLDRELSSLPPNRVLRMEYEYFCKNPETLIERIRRAVGEIKLLNDPVAEFPLNRRPPETAEEIELFERASRRVSL